VAGFLPGEFVDHVVGFGPRSLAALTDFHEALAVDRHVDSVQLIALPHSGFVDDDPRDLGRLGELDHDLERFGLGRIAEEEIESIGNPVRQAIGYEGRLRRSDRDSHRPSEGEIALGCHFGCDRHGHCRKTRHRPEPRQRPRVAPLE